MKQYFLLAAACLALTACHDSGVLPDNRKPDYSAAAAAGDIADDMVNIKLNTALLSEIDNARNELAMPTGSARLDAYLASIGAKRFARTFPNAGKHEYKQVQNGLNAWYTVWLDKDTRSVTRAMNADAPSDVVNHIEPVPVPRLEEYTVTELPPAQTRAPGDAPFDDPHWAMQWDLKNNGNIGNYIDARGKDVISSVTGADINIAPAWQITKGKPQVVVAVVDGGIDINHEDLKESLWVNAGEIPGNGIDDDKNGYVDDVNGYNFVDDKGVIVAQDHGTHVAGTIAARNNNGKGICGIAGGDGSAQSGARVMSCQIFKPNPNYDPTDKNSPKDLTPRSYRSMAAAIVYGANNGALISQNSWGFDGIGTDPLVIRDAITYFNDHAGEDAGALMKGGVVFFAAGNETTEALTYPAAHDNVIAVAAAAPDYTAAWYTNYGSWVDITAPGGSSPYEGRYPLEQRKPTSEILSCLPVDGGTSKYGYMQGTSMACPHVSGIAALVISQYGGAGFTSAQLKQRILTGVKPVDANALNKALYADKMGSGYIDAHIALQAYDENVDAALPAFVADSTRRAYAAITLGWAAATVPAGSLFQYTLYYSTQPLTAANYQGTGVSHVSFPASYAAAGEAFVRTVKRLKSNTNYYFALQATARNGKKSDLVVYNGAVATLPNTPPTIETDADLAKPVELAGYDTKKMAFTLTDKEGHRITYKMSPRTFVDIDEDGNHVTCTFRAKNMLIGEHRYTLTATDEFGAASSVTITVRKLPNDPPELKAEASELYIARGEQRVLRLPDLIKDEEPAALRFELLSTSNGNLAATLDNQTLTLRGERLGESELTLRVTDAHSQTSTFKLPALVYMNRGIYSLFPTIAANRVYVKLGNEVAGSVLLEVRNSAGKTVRTQAYDTNRIDPAQRVIALDVNKFTPGHYTVTLRNNNQTYTETFIKR